MLFYAHDRDAATLDRLAAFLMQQRWCGALVASDAIGHIEGTLPASLVGIEGPRAPDLAMSFRWNSHVSPSGYAGYAFSAGGAPELGQHGSMSRHEMRNSLFARGGSFKSGVRIASPDRQYRPCPHRAAPARRRWRRDDARSRAARGACGWQHGRLADPRAPRRASHRYGHIPPAHHGLTCGWHDLC